MSDDDDDDSGGGGGGVESRDHNVQILYVRNNKAFIFSDFKS